jgi:hypothetical protein
MTAALEHAMREIDPEFQPARIVTGAWLRQKSMNDFMTQSSVSASAAA